MFSIYEAGNHLLICADYIEPVLHSHSAAHIMFSLENEIEVILEKEKIYCRGILIPSGMMHTANTGENRVLIFLFDSTTNIAKQMNKILVLDDERVESALKYVQSNLQEPLTCSDVAKHVFLSEGRFSHLFKEQVGMTFAAYLIYQRVMKTYVEIIDGKSITEAAIEAGFSSSTHFAETSKRLFGLSASTIRKDLVLYKIAKI